jgi:hypothetical protein
VSLTTRDFIEIDSTSVWQQKKARALEIAHAVRDKLRALLGGVCQRCRSTEDLQFHHPHGRLWEPRRMNLRHRMRLYQRDYQAGLLELLCRKCNGIDGQVRARFYADVKNAKPGNWLED